MSQATCHICGGNKIESTVAFTVDDGQTLIVVRNTPATVCALCGEEWIDDNIAEQLEAIVADARTHHRTMEVTDFPTQKVA